VESLGEPQSQPFAHYDPDSCSWKTSQQSLLEDSMSSPPTWPRRGMTCDGRAYGLPISVPRIDATDGSLLPTPDASASNDGEDPESYAARKQALIDAGQVWGMAFPLAVAVKMLPTATAADGKRQGVHAKGDNPTMLPTPRASDGPHGGPNQTGDSLQPTIKALLPTPTAQRGRNHTSGRSDPDSSHHDGVTLNDWARLLPTPTARDHKDTGDLSGVPENSLLPRVIDRLLPTPSAADGQGGHLTRGGERSDELLLPGVAERLLPTPRTSDARGPGEHGTGGKDLRTAAQRLLPTPQARDHKSAATQNSADRYPNPERSYDLPDAIQWLRGESSPSRSTAGSGSPESQHPDPPTSRDD